MLRRKFLFKLAQAGDPETTHVCNLQSNRIPVRCWLGEKNRYSISFSSRFLSFLGRDDSNPSAESYPQLAHIVGPVNLIGLDKSNPDNV
ncbi:hypothetical protein PROAA_1900005 [Candidatus Propionivibrio aalborgensis]|uniref:Uncharacterized protein n=1 Tax=Candidatus Propionivibrio aalborgensis TaxID=1860101 RepID=A0A1A8XRH2_9RHOO|nr:hypothetical protein PROAA_1900005 [Candidatus Propionivibrio aalborgensis]